MTHFEDDRIVRDPATLSMDSQRLNYSSITHYLYDQAGPRKLLLEEAVESLEYLSVVFEDINPSDSVSQNDIFEVCNEVLNEMTLTLQGLSFEMSTPESFGYRVNHVIRPVYQSLEYFKSQPHIGESDRIWDLDYEKIVRCFACISLGAGWFDGTTKFDPQQIAKRIFAICADKQEAILLDPEEKGAVLLSTFAVNPDYHLFRETKVIGYRGDLTISRDMNISPDKLSRFYDSDIEYAIENKKCCGKFTRDSLEHAKMAVVLTSEYILNPTDLDQEANASCLTPDATKRMTLGLILSAMREIDCRGLNSQQTLEKVAAFYFEQLNPIIQRDPESVQGATIQRVQAILLNTIGREKEWLRDALSELLETAEVR